MPVPIPFFLQTWIGGGLQPKRYLKVLGSSGPGIQIMSIA